MKQELLNKLNSIARDTIIELNGKQYVKDTDTTNKTYWFNMNGTDKLTNEDVVAYLVK